jgi:dephospho-CoA kinase
MKIGITGGIGSGKSLVVNELERLGAKVYRADIRAKELVYIPEIKVKLIDLFGDEAFKKEVYNTKYISSVVFNDEEMLVKLNAIIHPAVFHDLDLFFYQFPNDTIVYESALMIETGHTHLFDKIILVTAPLELRIDRVIQRDHTDRIAVLNRIKKQWTDVEKAKFADIIIENINKTETISLVNKLWKNQFQ